MVLSLGKILVQIYENQTNQNSDLTYFGLLFLIFPFTSETAHLFKWGFDLVILGIGQEVFDIGDLFHCCFVSDVYQFFGFSDVEEREFVDFRGSDVCVAEFDVWFGVDPEGEVGDSLGNAHEAV